ncbi:MAG: glycosyltransferase family 4 protein [Candidatus Omnitrophota bacterium]
MKVLIVNRYMSLYGGAETLVKELASNLNRLGVRNLIVTLNISEEVARFCRGLEIVIPPNFFPYKFRSPDLLSSLGILQEINGLRNLVKKFADDFDLINVHNFPAEWVIWGLNKPVVWMCNEIPDFYNNPAPSLALKFLRACGIGVDKFMVNRFVDTIAVADEFNAARVMQRYKRKSKIIPYGIEYDFFSESARESGVIKKYDTADSFLLLQVGMLSPEKNQLKSIQAVEQLKDEIPNIKLILAGRPQSPYDELLKEYIVSKNLQGYIVFTEHLNKAEVRDLYHACKVALFPVKSQGGWLAPFEALCAAKPIIVSPTMGASAIIKKESLGLVTDNFVEAIRNIYENLQEYNVIGGRGQQWVKDNLTWEKFTQRFLILFKEVLIENRKI